MVYEYIVYFRFLPFFLEDFEGEGVSRPSPSLDATLSALVFWGGRRPFEGLEGVLGIEAGALPAAAAASAAA